MYSQPLPTALPDTARGLGLDDLGSGLFEGDGKIIYARYVRMSPDYERTTSHKQPCMGARLKIEHSAGEFEQTWSIGRIFDDDGKPLRELWGDDGKLIDFGTPDNPAAEGWEGRAIISGAAVSRRSNWGYLLEKAAPTGWVEKHPITPDLATMEGVYGTWRRDEREIRGYGSAGIVGAGDAEKKTTEVLVLIDYDPEKSESSDSPNARSAAKQAESPETSTPDGDSDDAHEAYAQDLILSMVSENQQAGTPLEVTSLAVPVMNLPVMAKSGELGKKTDPRRQMLLKLINSQAWLGAEERPWTVSRDEETLGEMTVG